MIRHYIKHFIVDGHYHKVEFACKQNEIDNILKRLVPDNAVEIKNGPPSSDHFWFENDWVKSTEIKQTEKQNIKTEQEKILDAILFQFHLDSKKKKKVELHPELLEILKNRFPQED
jgi:hypothetical protein